MPKCPHCSTRLPAAEVFPRAMLLGGPMYRITCPNCHRVAFLPRNGRNVFAPLLILAIAAIATLTPVLDGYLPEMTNPWPAIVRVGIWSAAVMGALALFAFASQLRPAPDSIEFGRGFAMGLLLKWVFLIAMVAWMYVIYRRLLI